MEKGCVFLYFLLSISFTRMFNEVFQTVGVDESYLANTFKRACHHEPYGTQTVKSLQNALRDDTVLYL